MAKIYENRLDYRRDVLKDQAADTRLVAEKQASRGLSFIGLSFFADLMHERRPQTRGWLRVAGVAAGVVGMVDVIRSLFTANKAHHIELRRDELGPERVILPPDVSDHEIDKDCGCKAKTVLSGPRSFADYAARSDDPLSRN